MLYYLSKCGFGSIGYCGEIPSNENEATLLGIVIFIRMFLKLIKLMIKFVSNLKVVVLIVSNLFAQAHVLFIKFCF